MSQGEITRKLFKVAKEFNVTIPTIVDALKQRGFVVDGRPTTNIEPSVYKVIDEIFGIDKQRNLEHEKSRNEYEDIKQKQRRGDESITIDTLSPLDELPLAPLDDSIDEEELPVKPQTPVEVMKPEPPVELPAPPVEASAPVKEQVPEPEPVDEELLDPELAAMDVEELIHLVGDDEDDEVESSLEEESEEDEDEIIRAKREKLKGTRVVGKIKIALPEPVVASSEDSASKKKKKRMKRAKKEGATASPSTEGAKPAQPAKPATTTSTDDSKKGGKKNDKKKRVDDDDVDQKMRETMLAMKQQSSVGKKRAKIRRAKRDEMAAEREEMELLQEIENETLEVTEFMSLSDLAELIGVTPAQIIMFCMNLGMFVSINQRLEANTIELIAEEFGKKIRFMDAEEILEEVEEIEDDPSDLTPRAPVVTVMGHVDHGKTSLLDYIRKAKVAAGEAGGITQHIGAYEVTLDDGRKITFLDTPGHEAFTAMRARGAQATDIVILVVAADDSVMPQTIEAINHAQAAGVSIVVAINKIDKPDANPDKIRQQLADHNVIVEEWGGKNQSSMVSAKTGKNIDELLEKVLIEAELMDLRANANTRAQGIIIESRMDKGKGVVANLLVQRGTLRVGDAFVAGQVYGKVRAMENEIGQRVESAGPSTPVQVTGFDGQPLAGDKFMVMDERKAKEVALQRQQIKREQDLRKVKHMTLDELSRRMALGVVSELNLIIKGDVDGSIEAISGQLQKLSTAEVTVKIIHTGVGAISESDVLLASASDAIIIGFQVRPSANARKLAEKEQIDIRLFSVIYDAIDQVKVAMEGLLSPEINERIMSNVDVRETFKVPGIGTIAGCYVTDGKISRNHKVRLIRNGIVIYSGEIDSLKRFKDDVKEVATGYECGISISNFNDIKVGDVIESYELYETKRKLS